MFGIVCTEVHAMSGFVINGGKHLNGELSVHGAKNSVLPLLAATCLCEEECVLHNCPHLSDVDVSIKILERLGCRICREGHTITVCGDSLTCSEIPSGLMREMRSSIVFMGAVAARTGKAVMSLPGGCELGPRPIDIHIDALKRLGAEIEQSYGNIICNMPDGAVGCELHLRCPSVGATENILLAAATGRGTTTIRNAAREPEISDLCGFLRGCGADISGDGSDTIIINGVKKLHSTEYTVMPDRIVAATYLFAGAACSGKLRLKNVQPDLILPVITVLKDCGCTVSASDNDILLTSDKRLGAFDTVSTEPYPGFPTDSGPLLVAFASKLRGTSVFIENIFDNRFRYVGELIRQGANIKVIGRVAVISGVRRMSGATVAAHDLRGGAALVISSLSASGTSVVENACYIDRGYEGIENDLGALGADIKRIV